MTPMDWLLRSILLANLVLLGLSFVPAFSGVGERPGLADRLWGEIRFGGWRADVAWMFGSTLLLLTAGVVLRTREPGARQQTSMLCVLWLPCFVLYMFYVVSHMFG